MNLATPSTAIETDELQAAVALFRARRLAEARDLCDGLIARAGSADDRLLARASYWAVRCARRLEKPDDALRLVYSGLAAARRADDGRVECLLRAELVHVLSALGQNNDALEQADAALQRARHLKDAVGEAAAQEALASIYWMTEDWELGLDAYRDAIDLAVACDHLELRVLCTLGLAATEEGVAGLRREAGLGDEAAERSRRSLALQRESGRLAALLGDDYLVMYSEINTGCTLHSLGALDEAKALFEACLADPQRDAVQGNALTILGRIALDQGRPQEALGLLQSALQACERMNKPFPQLVALETLVDAHEAAGEPAQALAHMRRYHALYVKNTSEKARLMARAMSVKYETERALAVAQAQRQRAEMLERSNSDLSSQAEFHARAALEDALTGLANRRRFDQALQGRVGPSGSLTPCSLALIDIDHFKGVNDGFSHQMGDEVLRCVGALLAANCRRGDLAARYGGEEFALLTEAVGHDEMLQLCERVRSAVERHDWRLLHPALRVTVSIGVARSDDAGAGATPHGLLARADARLYAAKRGGRNRVVADDDAALSAPARGS